MRDQPGSASSTSSDAGAVLPRARSTCSSMCSPVATSTPSGHRSSWNSAAASRRGRATGSRHADARPREPRRDGGYASRPCSRCGRTPDRGVDPDTAQEARRWRRPAPPDSGSRSYGRCSRSNPAARPPRAASGGAPSSGPGRRRLARRGQQVVLDPATTSPAPSPGPQAAAGPPPGNRRGSRQLAGSSAPPPGRRTAPASVSTAGRSSSARPSARVHGNFSAGPNWSMKWRIPASPPASR